MTNRSNDQIFTRTRPMLMGLAYRILGSHHDAEDVVQDVYETWLTKAADDTIQKPENWLALACSRKAIDRLRARKRQRETYPGEWLPEPVRTDQEESAEHQILLSESLTTAFLLVLEKLTPKERAAYLLRDVFQTDYQDIAELLAIEATTCRQLVSRARKRLTQERDHKAPPPRQQKQLVSAFHQAITDGNMDGLRSLLAADVSLYADAGGKATSISKPVFGAKAVGKFFDKVLLPIWQESNGILADIELNGQPGLTLHIDGKLDSAITFAFDSNRQVEGIFIIRNPDKLTRLDRTVPLT
ncbi:RNA polymerase sigma factor SigJ [Cohaesibacter intestini]|uniref:RNA polymerase sigma factor SigJ n=1 Tax=Cohaesibacter intestini TaxID=2211145 RepID=UPI000DEB2B6A|nr:RNA polymerase sigma factor SigJ [Cohaesibacter intestini]